MRTRKFASEIYWPLSSVQDRHFGIRMKWIADFHLLLNWDHFKNPKQNQNKSKLLKLFLSGKALEFSQCLLVCVYFQTILKLPVFLFIRDHLRQINDFWQEKVTNWLYIFSNFSCMFLNPNTAGPWLMRFSVVRFSLLRSLKKIQKILAYADFHQSPSLVWKISMIQIKISICQITISMI